MGATNEPPTRLHRYDVTALAGGQTGVAARDETDAVRRRLADYRDKLRRQGEVWTARRHGPGCPVTAAHSPTCWCRHPAGAITDLYAN